VAIGESCLEPLDVLVADLIEAPRPKPRDEVVVEDALLGGDVARLQAIRLRVTLHVAGHEGAERRDLLSLRRRSEQRRAKLPLVAYGRSSRLHGRDFPHPLRPPVRVFKHNVDHPHFFPRACGRVAPFSASHAHGLLLERETRSCPCASHASTRSRDTRSRSPSPWRSPPTRRSAAAAARTRIATARLLEFVASYGAPTRVPLERPGRPRVTARHDHPCRHRSEGPSAARGPFNSNGPPASSPDRHPLPKCAGIGAQVRRNGCPSAPESRNRRPGHAGTRAQVRPEYAIDPSMTGSLRMRLWRAHALTRGEWGHRPRCCRAASRLLTTSRSEPVTSYVLSGLVCFVPFHVP
jgi:hypothetical protein